MSRPDFGPFRELFPGASEGVFMNVAQRGLMPLPVRDAVVAYLEGRTGLGWEKEALFERVEGTRARFARLVNADPVEIAFTKNVTEGMGMIAGGIAWRPGDRVVLCADLEHPANVVPWYNAARKHGIEVRRVAPRKGGWLDPEAVAAAVDDRTRLVTVPTVSFAPGFVTDVERISRICREAGARLVVDAAQSVGILHTDVEALGVDALAVATQKGLLSCYGLGFLYCRREFAEELEPAALGRFGVALEEGAHETALADEGFAYAPGALRFEGGNYNYLGITAVHAALALLEDWGTDAIEARARGLARRLATGFLDVGLPVCGGAPGEHLGHIVSVGTSGGGRHYTADDPAMNALHQRLTAEGVHLSIRRGVLRFSLHAYNDESDVDRVIELAS